MTQTHLRAVLTFDIPLKELTPQQQNDWRRMFADLQRDIMGIYGNRMVTVLAVREVQK